MIRQLALTAAAALGLSLSAGSALAADGITLRLTVRVDPGSQWELQRAIREAIKDTFDAEGIEIPFQQHDLHIKSIERAPDKPSADAE